MNIRQQNFFIGAEDGCCLRHEKNPAEYDHLSTCLGRLLAQFQGIAHEVGDILNLAQLIVVGENNGISLPLQAQDSLY